MTQLDVRTSRPRVPLVRGLDPGAGPVAPPAAEPGRRSARAAVLAVLALLALVLLTGVTRWPGLTSDDEGTYAAQAWAVLNEGALAHYTYWYDHPPLGWLQLAVLSLVLGPFVDTGTSVTDARVLVLVPSLVTLGLLYPLGRRLGLRRPAALAAMLLLGLSPLGLAYLRTAHLDTLALPWLVAAFALAATPRSRLWSYAGSGACFAVAVLTKETVLVLLPALALQVWQTCDRRTRAFCVTAFTVVLAGIGLVYPLYAVLKGELLPGEDHVSLIEAIAFQLAGRASTGSLLDASSASAVLLRGWLAVDPWLLLAGVVLVPVGLAVRRLRPVALAALLVVLFALRPGYLPGMYVTVLLPFAAVLAAGLADAAVGQVRGLRGPALARPAVALVAVAAVLALVAPSWAQGLRAATTQDDLLPYRQVVADLQERVEPDDRVLVDDTLYVDLVEEGLEPQTGAVWFFKVDREDNPDPTILGELPGGWRSFDYVVSTPVVRLALADQDGLNETREALANSRVLEVFGSGERRVEVREVLPGGPTGGS